MPFAKVLLQWKADLSLMGIGGKYQLLSTYLDTRLARPNRHMQISPKTLQRQMNGTYVVLH